MGQEGDYRRMDRFPLCSTGLCPLWGRCPASSHSNSQSLKAGQRISLTTYCPWATCFLIRTVLVIEQLMRLNMRLIVKDESVPILFFLHVCRLPSFLLLFSPHPLISSHILSASLPPFWAAAPKGRCPVGHRGEFPDVRPSVRPSFRPSFRPSPPPGWPSWLHILTLRPDSGPLSPQISSPGLKSALKASNQLSRPQISSQGIKSALQASNLPPDLKSNPQA